MADKTFKLEIITPDRVVLSDSSITSVVAPGTEGYLGVLANHAPLVTELAVGTLEYKKLDGSSDEMAVHGGFMEVFENTVTILAQAAETSTEIDLERAENALKRAQERLNLKSGDIDEQRAKFALVKAMNRLKIARHLHH